MNIVTLVSIICIAMFIVVKNVIIPNIKYNRAVKLMNSGKYEEACKQFEELDGYKDSNDKRHRINNEYIPNEKYNKAVELMNNGKYEEAYKQFEELSGYKDSNKLKKSIKGDYIKAVCSQADVGDIIKFGNYNRNYEWEILAKEDDKVLIISKYAIEERPYNDDQEDITWRNCSIRSWLNNEYLNSAFDSTEQSFIMSTKVINADNKTYGTYGGNDTTDKIFLLSIKEAKKFFTSNGDREATLLDGTSCNWWLRSPGGVSDCAALVSQDGTVDPFGISVDGGICAFRPALWIALEP